MNQFSVDDKTLIINNNSVVFEFKIMKAISVDSIVVVLLEIPPKVVSNDNIFGVNKNGDLAWKIQSTLLRYPNFSQTSYVLIREDEKRQLIATDFCGCRFIINPLDGKIIGRLNSVK